MAASGVGMFAISWLASRSLSPMELGFLLTFMNFGALMQLADFGLTYASLIAGGSCAAPEKAAELASLCRFVTRWNSLLSCASLAAVGLLGTWTFINGSQRVGASPVQWELPWTLFLLGTFAFQLAIPGMSLREGAGRPTQIWRLRLVQELAGAFACLAVLLLGGRLWSAAAYALVRAAVVGSWLRFGDPMIDPTGVPRFTLGRWFAENWAFQWRIGLSSLSGFFIFRAVTPIIFFTQGPVAGGQYGLALAVMNLLISVTGAWPMSQTARYASLLAAKKYREFDLEIPRTLVRSTAFAISAAAAAFFGLGLARTWGVTFAVRMAEPRTCAVLLACAVLFHIATCLAVFLRADGRDPLVIPSTVGGSATVLAIWIAARWGSLIEIAVTQLIMAFIGVLIALLICLAHRERRIALSVEQEDLNKSRADFASR